MCDLHTGVRSNLCVRARARGLCIGVRWSTCQLSRMVSCARANAPLHEQACVARACTRAWLRPPGSAEPQADDGEAKADGGSAEASETAEPSKQPLPRETRAQKVWGKVRTAC